MDSHHIIRPAASCRCLHKCTGSLQCEQSVAVAVLLMRHPAAGWARVLARVLTTWPPAADTPGLKSPLRDRSKLVCACTRAFPPSPRRAPRRGHTGMPPSRPPATAATAHHPLDARHSTAEHVLARIASRHICK